MKRIFSLAALAFLLGGVACAQEGPRFEVTADYSYFRVNPSLPSVWNTQNLNGGGGDVSVFFTNHFGVKADLQGYNSTNQCPAASSGLTSCTSGNLFTYMFGPVAKYRFGRFEPFGEVLFGGAHSNFYVNACNSNSVLCSTSTPDSTAFAFAVGGGVDFQATHRLAIRLFDADYVRTNFGDNFILGNTSQSNFRLQTGVQVWF
jgi:opacity protein-like surface antigen